MGSAWIKALPGPQAGGEWAFLVREELFFPAHCGAAAGGRPASEDNGTSGMETGAQPARPRAPHLSWGREGAAGWLRNLCCFLGNGSLGEL